MGWAMPRADAALDKLETTVPDLLAELATKDPATYKSIDRQTLGGD
jgi:hypothetical protein